MVDLTQAVSELLREVSATIIEPRFLALQDGDVHEKSVGELVTVADTDAETWLTARLEALLPGTPVVGEEACTENPGLIEALASERAWLVDPLDGTGNFVHGSGDWAVMVALVERGDPVRSWIWQPVPQQMYVAERGSGAWCDDSQLSTATTPESDDQLRGAVLTRFLDPGLQAAVARNGTRFGAISPGRMCAGVDYPAVIHGLEHFVLFWRTLPWDHAPGVLLLREAGGAARRPDGSEYVTTSDQPGLLIAADARTWDRARHLLA